ncbi:DNA methyltransferase [Clostridium vincentii]|uniref:Methyltransferase n=1 Tax=Clostridium vincentii TaxID=52704 RepID=A0A2T0BKR2_9CLOT|nr:DNA methyltransferase [Clostridium vincentii]PRR84484.1 putative methyltransferase [Clostridium vincentii]
MGVNSYLILKEEIEDFKITKDMFPKDFMNFRDISWVAQVSPFIKEFSKPGDLIFEPFAGMGTTIIGAAIQGRRAVGIELEKERFVNLTKRIDYYKERYKYIPELINGDSLTFEYPNNIDLVVTNFPYYNGNIEDSEDGNFYNIKSYNMYLEFIEKVIKRCAESLKKDGYMVAFSENIRNLNGNMISQAYDTCNLLKKYMNLKEERIILYEKEEFKEDDITLTNRSHEYVFICKKKEDERDYSEYKNALVKVGEKVKYLVIGSYGLFNICKSVLDNPPYDCDILVDNNINSIKNIVNILKDQGYDLYSWQDNIDQKFDYNKLKGRYYIRAIKKAKEEEYIIDITYECERLDFSKCYENKVDKDNITVASIEDISTLMKGRGTEKDKSLLCRILKLK